MRSDVVALLRQWLQPRLSGLVARPRILSGGTRFDHQGESPSFLIVLVADLWKARLRRPVNILIPQYVNKQILSQQFSVG